MLRDVPHLQGLLARHVRPAAAGEAEAARAVVGRLAAHGLTAYADEIAGRDGWPAGVLEVLGERRRAEARHALQLTDALQTIHGACQGTGVALLTMKGVALSALLHGDVARRGARDLDLLIAPASLGLVAGLLFDLGCVPDAPWHDWTPRDFASGATTHHEFGFRTATGVSVEVHTRLATAFQPHTPGFDQLWDRRQSVTLAGRELPTLSWPDAVVHLASHGFRHAWGRLVWLCDIAHVMARADVDWETAATLAHRQHERVALSAALLAAAEVLGAPLPADAPRSPRAVRAARVVRSRISRGELRATPRTMLGDHWRSRDSTARACQYLWLVATTMTPADCRPGETWPPSKAARLVRRPLRLARQYLDARSS